MPEIKPTWIIGDWLWGVGEIPCGGATIWVVGGAGHLSLFDKEQDALWAAVYALEHRVRYSKRESPSRQRYKRLLATVEQHLTEASYA